MRILSFDTSSNILHVALLEDSQAVWQQALAPAQGERQAVASMLMPLIDQAMREALWTKASLDLIVVNVGPGSFTGIRVGVITARSLAYALSLPLVPVGLLENLHAAACQAGLKAAEPAAIILSSTTDQYFFAIYNYDGPQVAGRAASCAGRHELLGLLAKIAYVFADEKTRDSLSDGRIKPLPIIKNIAVDQGKLAFDRLSLKRQDANVLAERQTLLALFPWQAVMPLYLRNPSVTLKENANSHPPHGRN